MGEEDSAEEKVEKLSEEKPVEEKQGLTEVQVGKTQIFALKTTAGQEINVANLIYNRAVSAKIPVFSILVAGTIRGYIFVEAAGPHFVDDVVAGVKHARQRVPGLIKISELERYIITKPVIEELDVDDMVEVTGGPLKGMKAKITKVDKPKNEVTLELLEATVTLPITVHSDYVRLLGKGKKREEG